jgi:hypothetical protein
MNQELGQHPVHVVLRGRPAQGLLDHHAGAVADAGADRLRRHRCMAAPCENIVQRLGQVRRGIDQGAVEVEHDGGVLEHGLSLTRALRPGKRRRRERRMQMMGGLKG